MELGQARPLLLWIQRELEDGCLVDIAVKNAVINTPSNWT